MSKYLPDKQKTNLPAIRAAFDALESDLDTIRSMIEAIPAAELPDDLAVKSDIPEPPDLMPICTRVDELTVLVDKLADMIPDESSIQSVADARAGAKVGPVKGRLTQLWQDLSEEKARVDELVKATSTITTIKQDLTETRQWLADLGRVVQSLAKEIDK